MSKRSEQFSITLAQLNPTVGDVEGNAAKARELLPAIVVMDLRMPGLDGFEATRLLKSDARTAAIPVIALTAHAFVDAQARATQAGCDDVVMKPCFPEELLIRVKKILKERRHRKPQPA